MSTRSYVCRKGHDGFDAIYVHWDGYPKGVGQTLLDHYTDSDKIEELFQLGSLSRLSPEIGEKHSFSNPTDNFCVAYGRDRGEPDTEMKRLQTMRDVASYACGSWCEYLYVMIDGVWHVSGVPNKAYMFDSNNLHPLAKVLGEKR